MLYELSWVYVRLGDYRRAQRALEVLNISKPKGLNTADSTLLQADLLLRSGQYKKALGLYNKVRDEYDPIRDQVSEFLKNNQDPAVYYNALTGDEMEVTADGKMPKKAVAWAREAAEGDRVFSLIDDVRRSRDLIKRSNRMVRILNGVLATSTRAARIPGTESRARSDSGAAQPPWAGTPRLLGAGTR